MRGSSFNNDFSPAVKHNKYRPGNSPLRDRAYSPHHN